MRAPSPARAWDPLPMSPPTSAPPAPPTSAPVPALLSQPTIDPTPTDTTNADTIALRIRPLHRIPRTGSRIINRPRDVATPPSASTLDRAGRSTLAGLP